VTQANDGFELDAVGELALLSFGANLGDRIGQWKQTCDLLSGSVIKRVAVSELFETLPIGGPEGQQVFANAALIVRTVLPAPVLVEQLLEIERKMGRIRHQRWGPRMIDLDLLLYGQQVIESPSCQVPHPRMSFRRFMLEPASEIASQWIHPICGMTVGQLLQRSESKSKTVVVCDGTIRPSSLWPEREKKAIKPLDLQLRAGIGDSSTESLRQMIEAVGFQVVQPLEGSGESEVRLKNIQLVIQQTQPKLVIFTHCAQVPWIGLGAPYLCLPGERKAQWKAELDAALDCIK